MNLTSALPHIAPGTSKEELATPCLVIDLAAFDNNLRKMSQLVVAAGKNLRPHAKTHKCSTIAKRQLENGAVGMCAAKLSEAEGLVQQGITNVLITGPVVTKTKIERFVNLLDTAPALTLVLDNCDTATLLNHAAGERGVLAKVILDIDVGQQRTGVAPDKAVELGLRIAELPNLSLCGLQAYAGHAQHIMNYQERCRAGRDCLDLAAVTLHALRDHGVACEIFTGGGTGTLDTDLQHPDLTEVQCGSYTLMDVDYRQIGSAAGPNSFTQFAPALTLLTTVISANRSDHVTVDAGLKSVYQDGPAPVVINPHSTGIYSWFGDEYGKVSLGTQNGFLPRLGDVLEMIVSHCDPTVNLFDQFMVTQGDIVVDTWPIDLRGRSQ